MSLKMLYLSLVLGIILMDQCLAKKHNYDNFDMEALLADPLKSKAFFECVSDETKCIDRNIRDMKHDMVEMVRTSCTNCTKKEKEKYAEAMMALRRSMRDSQIISMIVNRITNMFQGSEDGYRED